MILYCNQTIFYLILPWVPLNYPSFATHRPLENVTGRRRKKIAPVSRWLSQPFQWLKWMVQIWNTKKTQRTTVTLHLFGCTGHNSFRWCKMSWNSDMSISFKHLCGSHIYICIYVYVNFSIVFDIWVKHFHHWILQTTRVLCSLSNCTVIVVLCCSFICNWCIIYCIFCMNLIHIYIYYIFIYRSISFSDIQRTYSSIIPWWVLDDFLRRKLLNQYSVKQLLAISIYTYIYSHSIIG